MGYRVLLFTSAADLIATVTKAHAKGRPWNERLKVDTTPLPLINHEIGYLEIDRLGTGRSPTSRREC